MATVTATLDSIDPILGVVRRCTRCQETWPKDEEFWYFRQTGPEKGEVLGKCRACWSERIKKVTANA